MKDKQSYADSGRLGGLAAAKHQQYKHKTTIKKYNNNPKKCKSCTNKLPYSKRRNTFCNHSCAASCNNIGVRRHGNGAYAKKPCRHCGKTTKNLKYCGYKCQRTFEWKETKRKIEDSGIAGEGFNPKTPKRYSLETRGHKCEICGLAEWREQPIPIVLDHINGHAEDWRVENLRLICPNCDAQTPTYKGKNVGNGRHERRKRYKAGLSY